ncbi:hypothetical protein PILCRDRAFT_721844 [Piloderma croceum F 1598]|uniref:Uncharacterized protein n=1 Tax=Piloderma croceum (strain F 1598) TaxID=765440 RepID=A0A0C3B8T5_PILCF|nr:hypothetical protein PILCRDRAFT_721844 [Piloderma croceum F 1598]
MTPPGIDKAVSAKPVRTKRRKEERSRHQRNRESTANRVERISALCRGQRKRKRNHGQERERLKTHGPWGRFQMYLIFTAWAPRSRMQTARSYKKKRLLASRALTLSCHVAFSTTHAMTWVQSKYVRSPTCTS